MIFIETNDGLYEALVTIADGEANFASEDGKPEWHERMGQCSQNLLKATLPHVKGMNEKYIKHETSDCEPCQLGKSTKAPRKSREGQDLGATRPVERVYTDVVGPMNYLSVGKAKYFFTLLDEYSGYSMVHFSCKKNETGNEIIEMIQEIENLFNSKIETLSCIYRKTVKWIRSDGGGEYEGHVFQNWLKQRCIIHEMKKAYSPESNSRAERLNRTLLDMSRAMMLNANTAPKNVLAEAGNTDCYIRNRLVTRSCSEKYTPYDVINKRKPSVGHLRKFGCKAYVHKPEHKRDGKWIEG